MIVNDNLRWIVDFYGRREITSRMVWLAESLDRLYQLAREGKLKISGDNEVVFVDNVSLKRFRFKALQFMPTFILGLLPGWFWVEEELDEELGLWKASFDVNSSSIKDDNGKTVW